MNPGAPGSSSLVGSLRGFAEGVLGSVQDRFELLSVELHEEKHRLIQTLVWVGLFLLAAVMALVFVSLAIVVACWNTPARIPVVVALAFLYSVASVAVGLKLRRLLTRTTPPFAATLEELRADRECIRNLS